MCELTLRQRFWAIRVAGGLFAALSLQSCASAGDETAGGIAAAKAKQLETARQQARAPFSAGEIATREVRPTTLRDSGQPDTIGYLRHVDFRFDGGRRLPGQPAGAAPGPAPAGRSGLARRRVVLRAAARQRYGARDGRPHGGVVQYGGVRAGSGQRSSLRRFAFALDDSTLTMHAEMRRRGAWVSIELRGPVMLRDPQTLVFHPNDVKVRGQDAGPLLNAAHIELADLLPVSTPAVQLIGSEIVMHVPALFPPPAIQLKLTAIRVAHDGLAMQFGDGPHRCRRWPTRPAPGTRHPAPGTRSSCSAAATSASCAQCR